MVINRSKHVMLVQKSFASRFSKVSRIVLEMFSRTRLFLKISFFQNAFRTYKNQATDPAGLESFLQPIINSPPKQDYSLAFFSEDIQGLLKKITNIDVEKAFRRRPRGDKLNPPKYKLLTNEELQVEMEESRRKADYFLQIPPVVNIVEDKPEVFDSDTSLDGHDEHHCKHIFTDTSLNKSNEGRIIIVREPNGILRAASKSERSRVNQIYHPIPGREMETPRMFLPRHLMEVIKRKDYEFILDRACAQFEPDDQEYHKVISVTYNAINYCKDFELLQSTRHYGSLAFYLVTHKNIDNILGFHIEKDGIHNAFCLVKLYYIIHPKCKSAELSDGKTELEQINNFIEYDSNDKKTLEITLQNYIQKEKNKAEVESGMREAHGLKNS